MNGLLKIAWEGRVGASLFRAAGFFYASGSARPLGTIFSLMGFLGCMKPLLSISRGIFDICRRRGKQIKKNKTCDLNEVGKIFSRYKQSWKQLGCVPAFTPPLYISFTSDSPPHKQLWVITMHLFYMHASPQRESASYSHKKHWHNTILR